MADDQLLRRVLEFAERGWQVFPLTPGTKKPLGNSHGFKDATTNVNVITEWWRRTPDANVGIATGQRSGVFVLDLDLYKAPACLKELEKRHGTLPETFTVQTPRDGRHKYFRMPRNGEVASGTDKLGRGIDVKGDGGYVVAPPSVVGGHSYKLVTSTGPATPPEWLGNLLLSHSGQRDREIEGTQRTQKAQSTQNPHTVMGSGAYVPSVASVYTSEDAVLLATPTRRGENHKLVYKLAGALKALQVTSNALLTKDQLRNAFVLWHGQALAFLKTGQGEQEYYLEFLDAWANVDHPLYEGVIDRAWRSAQLSPVPCEAQAAGLDKPPICLLISLCRELQKLTGDKPFHLSPYVVQRLFKQNSHSTAAKWLGGLCAEGILTRVEKGDFAKRKASTYHFNFKTK